MVRKVLKVLGGSGNTRNRRNKTKYQSWIVVVNNYTNKQYEDLLKLFTFRSSQYIIAKETGDVEPDLRELYPDIEWEEGTPHIQGYVKYVKGDKANPYKICFDRLKKLFPKAHFEKSKGSVYENYNYCIKENNYITNIKKPREIEVIKDYQLHSWQKIALSILKIKPEGRNIYHFFGGFKTGKTGFIKYLMTHFDAALLGGSPSHIKSQVSEARNKYLYIFPVSLGQPLPDLSTIEQIKDGVIVSHFGVKNNGGFIMPYPHVFIFSNERYKTNLGNFHPDKMNVFEIDENRGCKKISNNIDEKIEDEFY